MHSPVAGSTIIKRNIADVQSKLNASLCALNFSIVGDEAAGPMQFEEINLGALDVFHYEGQGFRGGRRDIDHIRTDRIDDFIVIVPQRVSVEVSQSGSSGAIEPGNFVILSTSRPFEAICGMPPHHFYSELVVRVPGALLRQRVPQVDQYCAIPISTGQGAGRVMQSMIESIMMEGSALSEAQGGMFGRILLDAIAAATLDAPELTGTNKPPRQQAHERIRLKALAFIECNLSNPRLDTVMIAEHCHVSLRHLHASFESASIAAGALIREMRLQRCRTELANPMLRDQSIIQIALKWGFASSGSFTRAYQRRFGIAPSEERITQALSNADQ